MILIPLQGPNGVRPKAPAVGAWQSPGYKGVEYQEYDDHWLGMRCDGLVVIDCDSPQAHALWNAHTQGCKTWVRKTPRGYHYIYSWTFASPTGPAVGIFPEIDVRAGPGSYVVYWAPNYADLTPRASIAPFHPEWLPEVKPTYDSLEDWDDLPDGRGNAFMTTVAGTLRRQGMSARTLARCLGAINQITMTREPMTNDAVAQIALSVSRYKPKPLMDIELVD